MIHFTTRRGQSVFGFTFSRAFEQDLGEKRWCGSVGSVQICQLSFGDGDRSLHVFLTTFCNIEMPHSRFWETTLNHHGSGDAPVQVPGICRYQTSESPAGEVSANRVGRLAASL